jgi:hypothetical protein
MPVVPVDPRRIHLAQMLSKVRGGDYARLQYVAKHYPPSFSAEYAQHWANSAGPVHHRRPAGSKTVPVIKSTALTSPTKRKK